MIQKLNVTFNDVMTLPEKVMATCFMSIYFAIPPESVYTSDRAMCASYPNQYDLSNSLGLLTNVPQQTSRMITFYFVSIPGNATDTVAAKLTTELASHTFLFRLNRFIRTYATYQLLEWDLDLPTTVQ